MPQPRDGERLSAADASNVVMDARDQVNVFLMAGILGGGGFVSADGGIDMDRLRAAIAGRLADPAFKDLNRFCGHGLTAFRANSSRQVGMQTDARGLVRRQRESAVSKPPIKKREPSVVVAFAVTNH